MNPLNELREYLTGFNARCRAMGWMRALFHVRVCEDIVADVAKNEARAAQEAYAAEQSAIEAERLIREGDRAALKKAVRLIRASSRLDHAICEQLGA